MLRAVLTDLSYLVQAAFPGTGRRLVPIFRRRYRRLAPRYEAHVVARSPGYDAALRAALGLPALSPRWCADIATGTGAAARLLRARFPQARIVAVDLSAEMLGSHQGDPAVARIVGNSWALPLADGQLDLAVVQNAPPGLSELARVVRPGGFVLVSLSSAGGLPAVVRNALLRRGTPPSLRAGPAMVAGSGVTWVFRKVR
jgi:ubiquinone/menaquinone biosynthesis C-methylase UbiE